MDTLHDMYVDLELKKKDCAVTAKNPLGFVLKILLIGKEHTWDLS
jgi:hypothetical protein